MRFIGSPGKRCEAKAAAKGWRRTAQTGQASGYASARAVCGQGRRLQRLVRERARQTPRHAAGLRGSMSRLSRVTQRRRRAEAKLVKASRRRQPRRGRQVDSSTVAARGQHPLVVSLVLCEARRHTISRPPLNNPRVARLGGCRFCQLHAVTAPHETTTARACARAVED
jgi:hypothetical protein